MRALLEGSSKGGSDLLRRMLGEETRRSQANLLRTEGTKIMHAMREGSSNGESGLLRRMSEEQEAEEDPEEDEERGMKATIPEGEHPFDYLFEGHQFLMAGCLLLEEIEVLESEELEQIKKLLDPYAERIGEFWLNVGEEK